MSIQNQGAICCAKSAGACNIGGNGGLGTGLGPVVGSAGQTFGGGGDNRTIVQKIADANDQAIHGGDSVSGAGGGFNSGAGGSAAGGGNVIDFPMVNPYKPAFDAREPIPGATAWPIKRLHLVRNVNVPASTVVNNRGSETRQDDAPQPEPEDEQSGSLSGFGFLEPESGGISIPQPVFVPQQPSALQSILTTIQSTLPATIAAARANPGNISGSIYGPYGTAGSIYPNQVPVNVAGGTGASIGAQTGAAFGNIGDTFTNIVAQHPYLTLGAVGALILLFMNPPKRR